MKQMDYDILVVGGGPAGLSAAQTAAKSGIKVGVIEKRREIGYPVHTSGGSFADELKKLGIPEKFMHPIHRMEFRSKNYSISFKYKDFKGCVLDIRNMYQYLAGQASREGAEIFVARVLSNTLLVKHYSNIITNLISLKIPPNIFTLPINYDSITSHLTNFKYGELKNALSKCEFPINLIGVIISGKKIEINPVKNTQLVRLKKFKNRIKATFNKLILLENYNNNYNKKVSFDYKLKEGDYIVAIANDYEHLINAVKSIKTL